MVRGLVSFWNSHKAKHIWVFDFGENNLFWWEILQSDGLLFGGFKDSTEIVSKNQEKIVLTQNIIRQLQLAKAAIHAGIKTLFFESKCTLAQIDTFYISGAFGNALNTENALAIALFPKISKSSFRCIDSTVFEGTQLLLQNKNYFHNLVIN